MNDDKKAKHEMMTKLLSWGTFIYLLIFGYSLNQHAMFELYPTYEQGQMAVEKRNYAKLLMDDSDKLKVSNDLIKSYEKRIKAAEVNLEARVIEDEIRDARNRAWGLISASTIFFLAYVFMVYMFYREYDAALKDYFVPQKLAIGYAIFMGFCVWITALFTAIN